MIKLDKTLLPAIARKAKTAEEHRRELLKSGSEEGIKDAVHKSWIVFFYHAAIDDHSRARVAAANVVADATWALFGQWRNGYLGWDETTRKDVVWDEALARKRFYWVNVFRTGLAAAAYLNRWREAAEIAAYADGGNLPTWPAEVSPLATPDSASFYVQLSKLIRGGEADARDFAGPAKHRSQRAKLLEGCVAALNDRNPTSAVAALTAYLKYYATRGRDRDYVWDAIDVDGTILYHFLRHHLPGHPPVDARSLTMVARAPQ